MAIRTAVIYTMAKAKPITRTRYLTKKDVTLVERKKRVNTEDVILVMLGGPFEKIGEDNEIVGGRSQKVGSNNK